MPYTLTLDVPRGFTMEAMLAKTSVPNPTFCHSYIYHALTLTDQKEILEQLTNPYGLIEIQVSALISTRNSERVRIITLHFSSKEKAEFFTDIHKSSNLEFNLHCDRSYSHERYNVKLTTSLLSPTAFKTLKSILISYFELTEQSVDTVLHMAGFAEVQKIFQKREDIKSSFKQQLENQLLRNNEETKLALEQGSAIKALSQKLMQEAQTFDMSEQLGRSAATLILGNVFLSFNLPRRALEVFKKIGNRSLDYDLAQAQIAQIRISDAMAHLPSQHAEKMSTKPHARNRYVKMEKAFIAALNARDPILAAAFANMLCECNENNELYTDKDFQYPDSIKCWLELFKKIREDNTIIQRQQEEIKLLKEQLQSQSMTNGTVQPLLAATISEQTVRKAPPPPLTSTSSPLNQATNTPVVHAFEQSCSQQKSVSTADGQTGKRTPPPPH